MPRRIKYCENGGQNMCFRIEDDDVYIKYNNIWNKIKELLNGIKFSSDVIYDHKHIKTKVKDNKKSVALFSENIPPPPPRTDRICLYSMYKYQQYIENRQKILSTSIFRTV